MDNVDIPTLPENDYFGDILVRWILKENTVFKDFEPLLPPPPSNLHNTVVEGGSRYKSTNSTTSNT